MVRIAARLWHSPTVTLLFSVLAVAALMQSTLLAMIDPTLLGWRPDHGHIYANGRAVAHRHPWDAQSGTTSRSENTGIVFTPGDDGTAGSVTGALTVPAATIVLIAQALSAVVAEAAPSAPSGPVEDVPAPPPRG